jgi:hypothetical protein
MTGNNRALHGQVIGRSLLLTALAVCCLALLEGPPVSDARQESPPAVGPSPLLGPERSLPTSHLFRDWYFDTGSGGFAQHYHDEPRPGDMWKQEPGESVVAEATIHHRPDLLH